MPSEALLAKEGAYLGFHRWKHSWGPEASHAFRLLTTNYELLTEYPISLSYTF